MKKTWLTLSLLLPLALFICSCSKDGKAIAAITVMDGSVSPVSGAVVTVYADTSLRSSTGLPPDVAPQTQTTGATGKVSFEYTREMILSVLVVKDSLSASETVHFVLNETTEKTVTLR